MRLIILALAAMTTSTACMGILFLYALVAPTRPVPAVAIVQIPDPDPNWRGGPIEESPLTVASDIR